MCNMTDELKYMLKSVEEAIYYEETSQNDNGKWISELYKRARVLRRAIRSMEKMDRKAGANA